MNAPRSYPGRPGAFANGRPSTFAIQFATHRPGVRMSATELIELGAPDDQHFTLESVPWCILYRKVPDLGTLDPVPDLWRSGLVSGTIMVHQRPRARTSPRASCAQRVKAPSGARVGLRLMRTVVALFR